MCDFIFTLASTRCQSLRLPIEPVDGVQQQQAVDAGLLGVQPGRCIKLLEKLSCNVCNLMDILENLSKSLKHFKLRCNNQS